MSLQIASPFQQFFDRDGSPLDNGFVYIGIANLNPESSTLTVYFDDALTIPAAQPLRTSNGYIVRNGSPARVYTSQEDFSLTVREKNGVLVYTVADATSSSNVATQLAQFISDLADGTGSSLVGYNQGSTGAVDRTVEDRLRERVSVKDFGAVGDGVTDDTAAIQAAIAAAADSKYGLFFESGKNYLVASPLSFSNSGNTVPRWVDFNGCVITASGSFSGSSVVYVENPQGKVDTFWMKNAYIDATGVSYGFYLKGGQDGRYYSLQAVNATSHGFLIQGETGFGIYYNVFDTCKAGGSTKGNGGDGFRISGVGGRFANGNTFLNCASQYNAAGGFRLGVSSGNTFIGCTSEENVADAGFVFGDQVTSVSITGGFTENNDYSGTDTSFRILSSAVVDNIRISGGRHNGTTNGDFTQDGIMYDTTVIGDVTVWNTDLKIRNLTLGGAGANIVSADATSIRFGDTLNPDLNLTYSIGSNSLRWDTVYCNDIDQNSTTGGVASAGAGKQYISLRIDGVNYKLLHDGTV
jgi:hypothetical protein